MITADGSKGVEKIRKALEMMDKTRAEEVALADKFLEIIKMRTPLGKGTGDHTRDSWKIRILRHDRDGVAWEIYPEGHEDIVTYLEFGTKDRIDPIVPKEPGGVLAFEWKGKTWFLKHVHHKGIKPLGIVRMTQDEINQARDEMTAKLHAALRSFPSW